MLNKGRLRTHTENGRLLEVKNLETEFRVKGKRTHRAVDGVSFAVRRGEIHGLVGESGSGKTVTALSLLKLVPPPGRVAGGQILWEGEDLVRRSPGEMRAVRGAAIAMIFQNPQLSLNPLYSIGRQMSDVIRLHHGISKKEALAETIRWLGEVRLPDPQQRIKDYPHQLSGGMCQRVVIAMALSCQPKLLIADEPTAALDVTIQAQILDLLLEIRERYRMAILLISHDLGVVARMCDFVSVMYLGRIMESSSAVDIYRSPRHPYTQALLKAVPVPDPSLDFRKDVIRGDVPSVFDLPLGCRFQTRCAEAFEACKTKEPALYECDENGTKVACLRYQK